VRELNCDQTIGVEASARALAFDMNLISRVNHFAGTQDSAFTRLLKAFWDKRLYDTDTNGFFFDLDNDVCSFQDYLANKSCVLHFSE